MRRQQTKMKLGVLGELFRRCVRAMTCTFQLEHSEQAVEDCFDPGTKIWRGRLVVSVRPRLATRIFMIAGRQFSSATPTALERTEARAAAQWFGVSYTANAADRRGIKGSGCNATTVVTSQSRIESAHHGQWRCLHRLASIEYRIWVSFPEQVEIAFRLNEVQGVLATGAHNPIGPAFDAFVRT